jgi:outer membrane protein TolC
MTSRTLAACALLFLVTAVAAGQPAMATSAAGERLTLESAVQLALERNRQLQTALLQVEKADAGIDVARTRRLPVFDIEVSAAQLLTPAGFAFPQGAFGDFPGTGPIPATDTTVTVPRQPTVSVSTQVSQPITQLVQANLGIQSAETTRDLEKERARGQRLSLVNSVKRVYFSILQSESSLTASREAIAFYRELDRTLQTRVIQQVALRADALDVQSRLAQEELTLTTRQNTLASQKEQLNQLLGRDVRTPFEVEGVAEMTVLDVDLAAAQSHAVANRPDVREAQLTLEQAELDRRVSKADRIPEISLALAYNSNFNIDVLPQNMATLGVRLKWEPFDWGRTGRELAVKSQAVEQARLGVREAEDAAVVEINQRFRALAEARARLHVVQTARAAAREKLRVKTNLYQVQAALLPDVLQLRAELADSDDRCQQALLAFWSAKADFEQAVGEEVVR